MNQDSNHQPFDPDLETRIVSFVLGEASENEGDQLRRLIEEQPELSAVKLHYEKVHGLMREVGSGEPDIKDDPWKLPADKRDEVLSVINGKEASDIKKRSIAKPVVLRPRISWHTFKRAASVAAVFCMVVTMALLLLPAVHTARESARVTTSVASIEDRTTNFEGGIWFDDEVHSSEEYGLRESLRDFRADPDGNERYGMPNAPATRRFVETAESIVRKTLEGTLEEQNAVQGGQVVPQEATDYDASADSEMLNRLPGLSQSDSNDAFASGAILAPQFQQGQGDRADVRIGGYSASLGRGMLGGGGGGAGETGKMADDSKIARDRLDSVALDGLDSFENRVQVEAAGQTWKEQAPMGEPTGEAVSSDASRPERSNWHLKEEDADEARLNNEVRFGRFRGWDSNHHLGEHDSVSADPAKQVPSPKISPPVSLGMSPSNSRDYSTDGKPNVRESESIINESPARTGRIMLGGAVNSDAGGSVQISNGSDRRLREGTNGNINLGGKDRPNSSDAPLSDHKYTDFGKPGDDLFLYDEKRSEEGIGSRRSVSREFFKVEKELAQSYFDPSKPDLEAKKGQLGTRRQSIRLAFDGRRAGLDLKAKEDAELKNSRAAIELTVPDTRGKSRSNRDVSKEIDANNEAFSTFSLHVSDVSFKLAQAALARGQWPEAAKIRIEEFVNAFDYGDPMPCHDEKVACQIEQAIHPFLQQRNVLRVSMRTAAAGRASKTPLRLTLLLDSSGSMERIDRQQTVHRAFESLMSQLKEIDEVTLISFARTPRLLAENINGKQASELAQLIGNLPSEGGTNLEAAIELAFEKAKERQADEAQSRIILLTDGAVNLGDARPENLFELIKQIRQEGIAFDAAGISANGLNDEVLEAMTRSGDGRYYLLDSSEDADDGFAKQIAGALRPSAKNVKVQVEFNPRRVGRYRLLGFEKHLLEKKDFRNDAVDAAEMAAAESGVAIYQFEPKPDGEGDIGSVSVRFRDLSTGEMIENRWPIPYQPSAARCEQAAASLRIATSAALFAAALRGEPLGQSVDLKALSELVSSLPETQLKSKRIQQLRQMIEQARQIGGR